MLVISSWFSSHVTQAWEPQYLELPDNGRSGISLGAENYYFYLAFENTLCKDYITEKVHWLRFSSWIVILIGTWVYILLWIWIDKFSRFCSNSLESNKIGFILISRKNICYVEKANLYRLLDHFTLHWSDLCRFLLIFGSWRDRMSVLYVIYWIKTGSSLLQFWDAMSSDVVPVVYGGANYSLYAPPHSYINVDDFESIEKLGEHLRWMRDRIHQVWHPP